MIAHLAVPRCITACGYQASKWRARQRTSADFHKLRMELLDRNTDIALNVAMMESWRNVRGRRCDSLRARALPSSWPLLSTPNQKYIHVIATSLRLNYAPPHAMALRFIAELIAGGCGPHAVPLTEFV